MEIRTFLDVSTGHLTPSDAALLTDGCGRLETFPITVAAYEFGWIVSTAPLIEAHGRREMARRLRQFGLSDGFISIAERAGRAGCWLLRFDREEDLDPEAPIGGYGLTMEEELAPDEHCTTSEETSVTESVRVADPYNMAPSEVFDRLWALRERHGDDLESAVSEWRRFLVDRERERCLSANVPLPAFRMCPDWGHYFSEGVPESTVRWVFDRRSWSLARLEVLNEAAATWRTAIDEERADVDESLIVANLEALTGAADDWGCIDTDTLPEASSWELPRQSCNQLDGGPAASSI